MKTAEIPAWMISVITAIFGAFTAHTHPDWAQWIVAIVACLTHHMGRVAGKAVSDGPTS